MNKLRKQFIHAGLGFALGAGLLSVATLSQDASAAGSTLSEGFLRILGELKTGNECDFVLRHNGEIVRGEDGKFVFADPDLREIVSADEFASTPGANASSEISLRVWASDFRLAGSDDIEAADLEAGGELNYDEESHLDAGFLTTCQGQDVTTLDVFWEGVTDVVGNTQNVINRFIRTNSESRNNVQNNGVMRLDGGFMLRTGAAGDGLGYPLGVWTSYQHNDFDNDFAVTSYDGDRDTFMVGLDFVPWDGVLMGVAFGYENTDIDTVFNGGQQEIDGYTIAPYLGVSLNEYFDLDFDLSMDFTGGYTWVDIDQFRLLPGTRFAIDGSTESTRAFFSGNLNAGRYFGNFYVTGFTGFLVAGEDIDGFIETDGTVVSDRDIDLGEFRIGGDVAYTFGAFEPFVRAAYEYNYDLEKLRVNVGPQPSNDDDQVRFGLGARYFGTDWLSGSAAWNTVFGRDDFDSNTFSIQIRAEF